MVPLGKRFQLARQRRSITLEQASKALRIRPEFLDALETGRYNKLPSSAYAHGFVENYADYLGLPGKETIAMFRREFDEKNVYKVLPEGFTKNQEFKVKRLRIQHTIFFIAVIFLLTGSYILYQYRFAFINPPLDISMPKENEIVHSTDMQVSGKTDPNATVMVNTGSVSVDKEGNFTKNLDLFEGKTVIRISATNRFGKQSVIERHVEVKPN